MLRVGFVLVLAICIFHASASERSLVSSFNKDTEHSIMLNLALTHREMVDGKVHVRTLRNFHSEGFKIKNSFCWLSHHSFFLFQTNGVSSSQKTLHPLCLLRPASDFFKEENGYVNASVERRTWELFLQTIIGEHPVTTCWGCSG